LWGLALAGFFVTVATHPSIAGGPDGPVGEFGGRSIDASEIRIADLSVPEIRIIDRATLRSFARRLHGLDAPLDPYGVAATGDGTIGMLAGKGRFLVRFSEATGGLIEKRLLAEPGQGITALWGRVAIVAVRLRPGEPMLLRAVGSEFVRFSSVASRTAAGVTAALLRNLFRCGSGTGDAVPCWFSAAAAGTAEVFRVAPDGGVRTLPVPSFASPAPASGRDPGDAVAYPVRDVFAAGDNFWVLSNQEGDRSPLDAGARRGRHVAMVREGRPPRIARLDREARAILDAGPQGLVLLFADGTIARTPAP
jgi:hypothetical protein